MKTNNKTYDLTKLLENVSEQDRVALAYNILFGADKGILGKPEYECVCFTKDEICKNRKLIEAYEKFYPENEGYHFRVKVYSDNEAWYIPIDGEITLQDFLTTAYDISNSYTSVEVVAIDSESEEDCILYIGNSGYDENDIGSMRIAEFQDVRTLRMRGLYV